MTQPSLTQRLEQLPKHERDAVLHHQALDKDLVFAAGDVRLLSSLSWSAAVQEAFLASVEAGNPIMPEVTYPNVDLSDTRAELTRIKHACDAEHPLGDVLTRTANSYLLAIDLLEHAGSNRTTELSAQLYGTPEGLMPGTHLTNHDAAEHFVALSDEVDDVPLPTEADYVLTPQAMQEELQEELNRFFVDHPVNVMVDPDMVSKAAAGSTRIRLRGQTGFTEYDRHQLLQHEAFIHTLTGINGKQQPVLSVLRRSAPRVTATQEGLATFAELITGAIDIQRLKRISMRILAIKQAMDGASFIDVFRMFQGAGQTNRDSFTSAMRVFRGCDPKGGAAFCKDAVYLAGLVRVHTFFRWSLKHRHFRLIQWLFAGKMALRDVFTLEPMFEQGIIAAPVYLPPWLRRANGLAGMLAFSLFANKIRLDDVDAESLDLVDE